MHPYHVVITLAVLCTGVAGQVLQTISSTTWGTPTPAVVGDVNGDGCPDIAVGDPNFGFCGGNNCPPGQLQLYSGSDGSLLVQKPSSVCNGQVGSVISGAGDWNHDGREDVVVVGGYGFLGHCRAWVASGLDGSVIHCLDIPPFVPVSSVARIADVNGDGRDEVLVGLPSSNQPDAIGGSIRLFAGGTGKLLLLVKGGPSLSGGFGGSVADAGDVDGDGVTDLLASSPFATPVAVVRLLSGRSGEVIHEWTGMPATGPTKDGFGKIVGRAGDGDGDGTLDVLITLVNDQSPGKLGHVRVYSGATAKLILGLDGSKFDGFGHAVSSVGDLDFDGHDDLAVSEPRLAGLQDTPGRVLLFSGVDGSVLAILNGKTAGDHYGLHLSRAGDFNGDGLQELLVGGDAVVKIISGLMLIDPVTEAFKLGGDALGEAFGSALAGTPDLDGDGLPDLVVGAPSASSGAGAMRAFSGLTGKPLFERDGDAAGDALGAALAGVGDVDGDGTGDVIAGAPLSDALGAVDAGVAVLISGVDGTLLRTLHGEAAGDLFGSAVAGLGDVDGDGVPDVAVGAPGHGQLAGAAYVYSGLDGALLFRADGVAAGARLGAAVAAAGDVDGDGSADLLIGAPGELIGAAALGQVLLLSGANGVTLLSWNGKIASGDFGSSLAGGTDLEGDGVPDLVVGAPKEKATVLSVAGVVRVYSGTTGALLWKKAAKIGTAGIGRALASPGDTDGDGISDVIMGTIQDTVRVYRGSDGKQLAQLDGTSAGSQFGLAVAGLEALGDGSAHIAIGATLGGPPTHSGGEVSVFSLAPQWTVLGGGVSGAQGQPLLTGTGTMVPGQAAGLALEQAPRSAHGLLVLGLHAQPLPFHGGAFVPSADIQQLFISGADGSAAWTVHWTGALPSGTVFFAQAWLVDDSAPSGFSASDALLARVP